MQSNIPFGMNNRLSICRISLMAGSKVMELEIANGTGSLAILSGGQGSFCPKLVGCRRAPAFGTAPARRAEFHVKTTPHSTTTARATSTAKMKINVRKASVHR